MEFGVNSIPCTNNNLCLSLIPKGTESETVYSMTWDELRAATILLCSVKPSRDDNCDMCKKISELLSDSNVADYMRSAKFRAGQLPVQTAMCDNFKGWGNFANFSLGIVANVCKPHATGNNVDCDFMA